MSGVKIVGDWKKAKQILAASPGALAEAVPQAVMRVALTWEAQMKKNLGRGVAPLAGGRRGGGKGGSRPLNKSGDLRGSIHAEQDGDGAFIGVNKQAAGHDGKVYNIARVHEFGATIVQVMTDKQRRFLFAVVFTGEAKKAAGGVKGFLFIRIPARPFVQPTYDSEAPKAPRLFLRELSKLLGGSLGTP